MFVSLGFFWNYRRKMFKVRIYISKSLSNRWNAEKAISRESEHTVRISQKSDKILDFIAFFKVSFKAYFFQHKVPLESRFYFMHDHWIGQYNFCSFDPYCIKKIYNELKILQWKPKKHLAYEKNSNCEWKFLPNTTFRPLWCALF